MITTDLTAILETVDALYIVDVIITNFFTAHITDTGEIITSKKELFKIFYKNTPLLIYTFLAITPFYLILSELRFI